MAIKTDAMIAHNGAEGYTLHIDYDPETEYLSATAIFNDGTTENIEGSMDDEKMVNKLIEGTVTRIKNEEVTYIKTSSFSRDQNLISALFPAVTRIAQRAFYVTPALVETDFTSVKVIESNCFDNAAALQQIILPSIEQVDADAFRQCPALKYVYLGANAATLSATMFNSVVTNVTIDCGFSSTDPAAANAPWGAANATINYDVPAPNPPVGLRITPDPGLIQNIDLEPLEEIQPVEPKPVEVKKTKRSAK